MARRPRLDMAGYHHVVNRGVEQRKIFLDEDDYLYFLGLVCKMAEKFDFVLHNYCLMSNHYHLLLETKNDNLSKVMRSVNANYASYFNRKNKRVGHLWQGRFKSWYVADDAYLYTLIKYIEFNPVKANIVKQLGLYKYSSYNIFMQKNDCLSCMKDSLLFIDFKNITERQEFFESFYDEDDLKKIAKSSSLVVFPLQKKEVKLTILNKILKDFKNKKERNVKIEEAIKEGFSQSQIAKVLGISQPAVSNVFKG